MKHPANIWLGASSFYSMKRFGVILLVGITLLAMKRPSVEQSHIRHIDSLMIVSYNVENLFDTIHDERINDVEFTPEGAKHWTSHRYHRKLQHISQTISRVGGRIWPSLVTLVEVENAGVIEDLLHLYGLWGKGYRYVITNSPDPRGVDVAMLYRITDLELLSKSEYAVDFTNAPYKKSRNVLECKFRLPNNDTLYAYGVHFPSRREGVGKSEPFRCDVAYLIRDRINHLYESLSLKGKLNTHFIVMGDFNEESHEKAIKEVLSALDVLAKDSVSHLNDYPHLYSLMSPKIEPWAKRNHPLGSYFFHHQWQQLDHFIISHSLLKSNSLTQYQTGSAYNFMAPFLVSEHSSLQDSFPFRTYGGNFYMGGYSDHFPVRMLLSLKYPKPYK